MSDHTFIVRVHDFDGDEPLTTDRIERAIADLLDAEGSDGTVVVEEESLR